MKRVTVPLEDGFLLLATMDNKSDHTKIIDGILKLVHDVEPKKCRNCKKELENKDDEFCSEECENLHYDLHKS